MSAPEPDPRLAARIRERHPDLPEQLVGAACRGMLTLGEEHRGLPLVAEQLTAGEPVHALAACNFKHEGVEARGVVVVLDAALVAAGRSPTSFGTDAVMRLELDAITGVTVSKRVVWAHLRVSTAGEKLAMKRAPTAAAKWVAEAIRQRRGLPGA